MIVREGLRYLAMENTKWISPIQKFCLLYLIIWTVSPPLSIDTVYRILALFCVVIWVISEINKGLFLKQNGEIIAILFLLLTIVASIITYGFDGVLKSVSWYFLVIGFLVFQNSKGHFDEIEGFALICFILLTIWNINTYKALLLNDRIARIIVRNDVETYSYLRSGIGGYGHIICQVLMSPVLFAWIVSAWKKHKIIHFCVGTICYGSFLLMLFKSSYAIPIMATILGLSIMLIGKGQRKIWYLLGSIIVIALFIYFIGYSEDLQELLIRLFPSNTVQNKINELVYSINSGGLQGDFAARWERYFTPIKSFFVEYPLIGGWIAGAGSGGHSTILDAFGKFGIFGGLVVWKIMFSVPNYYEIENDNRKVKKITTAFWIVIFITMLFDSWALSCSFVLFLIIPIMINQIVKWNMET